MAQKVEKPLLLLEGPNEAKPWCGPDLGSTSWKPMTKAEREQKMRDAVDTILKGDNFTKKDMPWYDEPVTMPIRRNWQAVLKSRSYFTPDFGDLKLQSQILLFVYGDEQADLPLHKLIQGGVPLGRAQTLMDRYALAKTGHRDPIMFEKPTDSETGKRLLKEQARVRGEAYLVGVEQIFNLDEYYLNGFHTNRVWRWIAFESDMPGAKKMGGKKMAQCFMYTANLDMVNIDNCEVLKRVHVQSTNPYVDTGYYYRWE